MKSITYYVASCTKCGEVALIKIDFMQFKNDCCLEMPNLKILKTFKDENEAKNYLKLFNKDEESE